MTTRPHITTDLYHTRIVYPMRSPAPVDRPVALSIAGSDSGGGAGIQADLQSFANHGAYGTTAITAVTAQHTRGVESSHVLPPEEIEAQLAAVAEDFDVSAAKTGMLATASIVELVTDHVTEASFPTVVDPVMVAASGDRLLAPAAEDAYADLVAEAAVVTPNADEAAVLTGIEIEDETSARSAGEALLDLGADAALVKGGHVPGDVVRDVLVAPRGSTTIAHPRVEGAATHGSGCTLASAIAARLAHGEDIETAVRTAIEGMGRAIRYHYDVGEGAGAVHHLAPLRDRAAREETAEAVQAVVDRIVDAGADSLLPEVGMNVVGATPYAESPSDAAAVEGRITRTMAGPWPNRGVRFGASSHVARFLIAAREVRPALRFAANCRFDEGVEAALDVLEWPVAEYDRAAEPEGAAGTMDWAARQVFEGVEEPPVAVLDRGAHGKEPMTKLVATDAGTLAERAVELAERVA